VPKAVINVAFGTDRKSFKNDGLWEGRMNFINRENWALTIRNINVIIFLQSIEIYGRIC
jgi:hypothetical protein